MSNDNQVNTEKLVLSGLLNQPKSREFIPLLSLEDFENERHRIIYELIAQLSRAPETKISPVWLMDALHKAGVLAAAGGPSYLQEIQDMAAPLEELVRGIEILRRAHIGRISGCETIDEDVAFWAEHLKKRIRDSAGKRRLTSICRSLISRADNSHIEPCLSIVEDGIRRLEAIREFLLSPDSNL